MSLMLALLAAAAPAASSEAVLLAHFDSQCAVLDSMDAIEHRVLAAGWIKVDLKIDSIVSKQARFYDEIAAESKVQIDTRAFSREDNPSINILVSQVRDSRDSGSIECHALNTTIKAVNGAVIENWAKRKPTSKSLDKYGMMWSWQPALNTNASFTAVTFTKEASKDPIMFPGVGLDAVTVKFYP